MPVSAIDLKSILNWESQLIKMLSSLNLELSHKMMLLTNRLESFKNWPFNKGSCTGDMMAYAGYYCVVGDSAKCVFCYKELDGWEETDDPWEEHKSHKADCPFVKLNKRNFELTVHEFEKLSIAVQRNILVDKWNKNKEEVIKKIDEVAVELKENIKKTPNKSIKA